MPATAAPGGTAGSTAAPASRLTVILASVLTIVGTSVCGYVSSMWIADHQTVRNEQINQLNGFLTTSGDLEPLIREHIRNLLKGKSPDESGNKLLINIQEQHIQLEALKPYIPERLKMRADNYDGVLVKLAAATKKAQNPLTAGPLMQQANDAVVAKRRLTAALREGVGLPV